MLVVCALAAAGCDPGTPAAGGPDLVRVVVLPFLTQSPFQIALDEGHFAARGLEVELLRLPRIQELNTALATGEVDAAAGMLSIALVNSMAAGSRIRMVATMGALDPDRCPFHGWVSRRELAESGALEDPARLRELRFDTDPVITDAFVLSRALEPFGLTLDDVDTVNVPPAASGETLLAGSIDVTGLPQPFLDTSLDDDRLVLWRASSRIAPGFPVSLLLYGPTFLDERPEVGERFLAALLEATEQFRQGKTPRNMELVGRFTGLSPERLSSTCWPTPPEHARVDYSHLRDYQRWAVDRGLAETLLLEEQLVDHRFLEAAMTEDRP